MEKIKRICICGGGGLGHTCVAVLSSHDDVEVMLYTQHPERWNKTFVVDDCENKIYNGRIVSITNKPEEVVPFADLVLLCLPAFLVEKTLIEIQPFLLRRAKSSQPQLTVRLQLKFMFFRVKENLQEIIRLSVISILTVLCLQEEAFLRSK